MFSATSKRFLICVCLVLAVIAVIGMTPGTHKKSLLKPITLLYSGEQSNTDIPDSKVIEYSESNKVMVKPDDAKKDFLNVEVDATDPNKVLPVDSSEKNNDVDNLDFKDTDIDNEKIEVMLNEAPLL